MAQGAKAVDEGALSVPPAAGCPADGENNPPSARPPSRRAPEASSPAVRRSMQGNKGKNTKPELLVRGILREAGLTGYRIHWHVAGRPDVAWPGKRVALMVNGCFWHRCPRCHPSTPSTHAEFWQEKFARNVERDRRNIETLEADGWTVHVVWECQLKKKTVDATMAQLLPQLSRELGKPLRREPAVTQEQGAPMTRTIVVDQTAPDTAALDAAAAVLADGGAVVMPTDSVYGIGAAAFEGNPGHERIFEIKGRDRAQTLPLLLGDPKGIDRFGTEVAPWAREAARRLWPGALTFVVCASTAVPAGFAAADGTVALRVPDSPLVRELARRAGGALAVTSANTHGAPSPASFSELEEAVAAGADLVLDGGACPVGTASTIVDATGAAPRILREGSVTLAAIEEAAGLS